MVELTGAEALQAQVDALDATLSGAAEMAAGFDSELRRMRSALAETGKDVQTLERGLSRGLRRALDGVLFDGMKLSDALRTVAVSASNAAYAAAVKPVADHFGGLMAQAAGGLMQGVLPFAKGGVVSSPTYFGMRGATGLMGEAGPEAIMPLSRGPDGSLGVRMQGSQPMSVVVNISTPDVEGFRRSQSQIAAQMTRALGRGQRNR